MSWGLDKRFNKLENLLASKLGASWYGNDTQFVEFVHKVIPKLSPRIQEDMHKYYILGQSRDRDENTGRMTRESAMFYQHIRSGRDCLASILRLTNGDPDLTFRLLKESDQL